MRIKTINNLKKQLICLTALSMSVFAWVSSAAAAGEMECVTKGGGTTEPNWMECYPLPNNFTLWDYSLVARSRVYPQTGWKVGTIHNVHYIPEPFYRTEPDNYRYDETYQDGHYLIRSMLWGQEVLPADKGSCIEYHYSIEAGNVIESGYHSIDYPLYHWAGCWNKYMLDANNEKLELAAELDNPDHMDSLKELRQCGSEPRYGQMVYAGKFEDMASPYYIPKEVRACCGYVTGPGIPYNLDDKCCIPDERGVYHIVKKNPDNSCAPIKKKCEARGRTEPCALAECLEGGDECPLTVVSAKLFKEIGTIREFPCPPKCAQGKYLPIIGYVPLFPDGCNSLRIPILQPCCTYHEGLRMDIVFEDCEGNQSAVSVPLHFGEDEGGNLGDIPVTCKATDIASNAPPAKLKRTLVSAGQTGPAPLNVETFRNLADDECVIEENYSDDYDVLICRCSDLSDSGFCVKKFPKGQAANPAQITSLMVPGQTDAPAKKPFPAVSSPLSGKDLSVTEVCEIASFSGISTEALKELLDWACDADHGGYYPGSNNCGSMHDQILGRLGIDPYNLGKDCEVDGGKCGKCLLGASDIADQFGDDACKIK